MNPEKLKKLQAEVRIGGKGTQRRKKKILHTTAAADDKKLQQGLKKLALKVLPGMEEVNIFRNDGTVLHIQNPKVQSAVAINTFAISGHAVEKKITELLPGILLQCGPKNIENLKKSADKCDSKGSTEVGGAIKTHVFNKKNPKDDDDVPKLVDNFEAIALKDAK